MRVLRENGDPDRFFERLARAARAALLLDYDGTLAPFCLDPRDARSWPGAREALESIMQPGDTRVVFVSGRALRDLQPLLDLRQIPELWGSHGWERRCADGRTQTQHPPEAARRALAQAGERLDAIHRLGGRCETKPAGFAIHWRGLDSQRASEIARLVTGYWAQQAHAAGLELQPFDGGLELRIPGRNKGDVVRTLHAELPDAPLAFLGDDHTDEDAFRVMTDGDLGVLVRPELRATAAALWLQPPAELLAFLRRWAEARGAQSPPPGTVTTSPSRRTG
jgi:trehalose-phosphatase